MREDNASCGRCFFYFFGTPTAKFYCQILIFYRAEQVPLDT